MAGMRRREADQQLARAGRLVREVLVDCRDEYDAEERFAICRAMDILEEMGEQESEHDDDSQAKA